MIEAIINQLKNLDLQTVSDEEVIKLMKTLGTVPVLAVKLQKDRRILRGVTETTCDDRTRKCYKSNISYISDPEIIPKYNRASIEGKSVFYGAVTEEDQHYSQVLTIFECGSLFSNPIEDQQQHEEYVTMGMWKVVKEIELIAVCNNKDFHPHNEKLMEFHDAYLNFIHQFPDKTDEYLKLGEYLSYEFAKKVENTERWRYKISAAFAHNNMEIGMHGILYPTAQDFGKGFNVAIRPEIVDQCLELEKVAIWRLVKKGKEISAYAYLYCDSFQPDGKFIWTDPMQWIFKAELDEYLRIQRQKELIGT